MLIRTLAIVVALALAVPAIADKPPSTQPNKSMSGNKDCKGATGQARADCAHWENEQRKRAHEAGKEYDKRTKDYDKASKEYAKDAKYYNKEAEEHAKGSKDTAKSSGKSK